MEATSKRILVTWDFSSVSDYALQHALKIAKIIDGEITLVHITKKEKDNSTAEQQLKVVVDDAEKKYGYKPDIFIKEGSIFTTISEIIEETKSFLVVMGTHGMKGMQKITGSWALKVIAGSRAPFFVVQAPPQEQQLTNIAFPVDYKIEDKQKSAWAVFLFKHFGSKIHMFKQHHSDPAIAKKIHSNVIFTKKAFDNQEIDYDEVEAPADKDFSDATIDFAKSIKADAIMVTTTKDPALQDFMFGATEQKIIGNKDNIAVMCVNPRDTIKLPGFN